MCLNDGGLDEIELNHKFIGRLCKLDDNLLSFLCGIFSNIPISFCFIFTKIGDSNLEYANFALTLFAIIVSIALIVCAFKFTLGKMRLISPRLAGKGETDSRSAINDALEEFLPLRKNKRKNKEKLEEKNKKQITKYIYLKRSVCGFIICAILLIIAVITIWVLSSLIG